MLVLGILVVGIHMVREELPVESLGNASTTLSSSAVTSPPPAARQQPPRFSGVTTYLDPLGRFSIRYPSDWYLEETKAVEGGQPESISFRPNPDDPQTSFSVSVRELGRSVVAEDVSALRRGVQDQLDHLAEIQVERSTDVVLDNLIKLEVVYSFRSSERDSGASAATLERKTWLIYGDRLEYTLTWQGSSPQEYEYWLAMANYSFAFLELPPSLWLATDRDPAAD